MKVLAFLFCLIALDSLSQDVTTFILIRHAEKLSGNMADKSDPDLTEEGKQRAQRLVSLLKDVGVDAIYSTNFKRTQYTVAPLSAAKGIAVKTYEPKNTAAIDAMLEAHRGGTIVVCGHSNTTPWTANYLAGKEDLKDFDDSDYDNVLIVSVTGKKAAKVLWLNW